MLWRFTDTIKQEALVMDNLAMAMDGTPRGDDAGSY